MAFGREHSNIRSLQVTIKAQDSQARAVGRKAAI